jgi:sulfur-oxidizing protein SoxZ
METGRRQDKTSGAIVPAHFIETVKVELEGKLIADCQLSTAVSRDPYLSFRLRGANSGATLQVSWMDNHGGSDRASMLIP